EAGRAQAEVGEARSTAEAGERRGREGASLPEERFQVENQGIDPEKGLPSPNKVQKLQEALHAKAKESPGYRFYALYDKVWRADVLTMAYYRCAAHQGAAGVDGQTFADIQTYGVERWLGELAQELRAKTYRPQAVRRVWIPKADGK